LGRDLRERRKKKPHKSKWRRKTTISRALARRELK